MKLYTYPQAPSLRRVHLFLAEKGDALSRQIEQIVVDLRAGAHLSDEFGRKSPCHTVPVLELDDGRCLSECGAICRYLEAIEPEPPLFGRSPEAQGIIADREHWVEMNGLLAVMEAFRNTLPGMADHALPGRRPVPQIAALAERGRRRYEWFLEDLDGFLAASEYIAGDDFSQADLTALVTIDFAVRGIKLAIPGSLDHVRRWYEEVASRPSVKAVGR